MYRVEVIPLPGEMPEDYLLSDIAALNIRGVQRVARADLYFLRGDIGEQEIKRLCDELLVDPVVQRARWGLASEPVSTPEGAVRIEVGLLQGVTDTVAANLLSHAHLLGVTDLHDAASAQSYLLYGQLAEEEVEHIVERLLYNDVIQYFEIGQLESHLHVELPPTEARAERIPLTQIEDENELLHLSHERLLALDVDEMRAVQRYFREEGREPTDVELESLAQTWSEHCIHKTFKGVIDYTEITDEGTTRERIDSLIATYLSAATDEVRKPWVRSAFVDNAGIVDFDDDYAVSFKVETHNHPSALEPFGGANTGVGGVVRDVMGVSARPIANTDILCFGPLDTENGALPAGVLHPRRIYNGVVAGIEDYGNKMGIPTVNGTIYFDPGYITNPLVYCGCVGIAPKGAHPRAVQPGDLVVVLGGRTGRDGLHGATFSSAKLTDQTGEVAGSAVQIGNPIEEKKMLDAILEARDEGLYTAITDCGAGGLSSAVSEMGEETGATVHLERVPLKYHGLQPWEIWLSEAQERMVLAVPPENRTRLREICEGYSVEMTVIGTFRDDARLHISYGDEVVGEMSMAFLHHGLPQRHLEGVWEQPDYREPTESLSEGEELGDALLRILGHANVRSKEDVVRRYDHEVQGGTVVKPFVGRRNDGPSDATVLKPLETAGSWRAIALGCGFNPAYGQIDPHAMAVSAIDEAVRNVVAVGADPERIAILDNFCWGSPELPDRLGGLVRACKGCYEGALHYGVPFISGKDSLNNEYTDRATGQQVAVPPSLLISALGIVPDIHRVCTMDFKETGDPLYILGETRRELGGSRYYALHDIVGQEVPRRAPDGPATARALHRAIAAGTVRACHDCSEGGLAVALAEMALAGRLSASIFLSSVPLGGEQEFSADWVLFSESNGRYLVEVREEDVGAFEEIVQDIPHGRLGHVNRGPYLVIYGAEKETLFSLPMEAVAEAWRGHIGGGIDAGRGVNV
ncbi:MAG: phosphoribosylformylglycinamidine synthase subunit PurL [Chloroflexota bacterium]|nr:phosphoribosylformylglycinamidine synthase subunit PurL [Chloroflexota bacterium]